MFILLANFTMYIFFYVTFRFGCFKKIFVEDRFHGNLALDSLEDTDEVKHWSEQWRLVVGKILQRDIELTPAPSRSGTESFDENNNSNNGDENGNNLSAENETKNDSQTSKSRNSTFIELSDRIFKI